MSGSAPEPFPIGTLISRLRIRPSAPFLAVCGHPRTTVLARVGSRRSEEAIQEMTLEEIHWDRMLVLVRKPLGAERRGPMGMNLEGLDKVPGRQDAHQTIRHSACRDVRAK